MKSSHFADVVIGFFKHSRHKVVLLGLNEEVGLREGARTNINLKWFNNETRGSMCWLSAYSLFLCCVEVAGLLDTMKA